MGRKIPGKKHRGVKDPLKQQAKRQAELETKANAPPKDANEQAIPKSLERIVKLKNAVKSGRIGKQRKKKRRKSALITVGEEVAKALHPKAKPDKIVPVFKQKPGEPEDRFLYRVSREAHNFINETTFEKKYGVQVNRNPETGNIEGLSKCEMTELDKIEMLRAKHKNIKNKKGTNEIKMSKNQKKKEKLRMKREKRKMNILHDFTDMKDHVRFGEVAHEPPQIKVRPKTADSVSSAKPGKKDLLLHSLLKNKDKAKVKKTINKSGKRKNLPIGERRQLDKDQKDAIEAYRKQKAKKSTGIF